MRSLLELGNHFAAVPLVDLAVLQESRADVVLTIQEALRGVGPAEWIDVFTRGVFAVEEYAGTMTDAEFATRTSRAHYGAANTQAGWLVELVGHIYHHRGELYTYLQLMEVRVTADDLYT